MLMRKWNDEDTVFVCGVSIMASLMADECVSPDQIRETIKKYKKDKQIE